MELQAPVKLKFKCRADATFIATPVYILLLSHNALIARPRIVDINMGTIIHNATPPLVDGSIQKTATTPNSPPPAVPKPSVNILPAPLFVCENLLIEHSSEETKYILPKSVREHFHLQSESLPIPASVPNAGIFFDFILPKVKHFHGLFIVLDIRKIQVQNQCIILVIGHTWRPSQQIWTTPTKRFIRMFSGIIQRFI